MVACYGSGAEGDRTPDLSIANAALSQLSYCPEISARTTRPGLDDRDAPARFAITEMGARGFEPLTSTMST